MSSDSNRPTEPATPRAIKADKVKRSPSGQHYILDDVNEALRELELVRLRAKVAELEAELATRPPAPRTRVLGVEIGGGPQQTFTGDGFDPRREP
jgi:hypothetical protein